MLQEWISDREKTMPTSINKPAGRDLTFVECFFFFIIFDDYYVGSCPILIE
jgi:hypothetical protein